MNAKSTLYDQSPVDILLLEESPLQGRKPDLRLLLKSLNLAKSGQPKSVLITGDAGIGKTALMNAFVATVDRGLYCQVLDLRETVLDSPERIFCTLMTQLEQKANDILEAALVDINQLGQGLNLDWTREDLLQAISLVEFQEFSDETGALVHQEALSRSISQSTTLLQKIKPSTKDIVERLVRRIVEPWVLISAMLVDPRDPQIQKAMQRAKVLATELDLAGELLETEAALLETEGFCEVDSEESANAGVPTSKPVMLLDDFEPVDLATETLHSLEEPKTEAPKINKTVGELGRMLLSVFHTINKAIRNRDSALLLVMDNWEQILHLAEPQRERVKDFLAMILRETTEPKNYHCMVCVASRSGGESYTLGGSLYNLFRNKMLLSGLTETARRTLLREVLQETGLEIEDLVLQKIYALTSGNPFWLLRMGHYLKDWAASNETERMTLEHFRNFGIETPQDILEVAFSRVKLSFLHQEEDLHKTILGLVTSLKHQAFSVSAALEVLSRPEEVSDAFIIEVLRALFFHGFLQEAATDSDSGEEPRYGIQSRLIEDFLLEKTRMLQGDVSVHEKMSYLKKIIPLSLQSGELDPAKTQELLSLNKAMGNPEMLEFLEDTFLSHIQDPKPYVRVTALNNISALISDRTLEAVIRGLQDDVVEVREAAARALCQFCKNRGVEAKYQSEILEALMASIEDPAESVRAEIYGALSHFAWFQELLPMILKGISDPYEAVRLSAIRFLIDCGAVSPVIQQNLLQALEDPAPEIRKLACIALQRYPDPETVRLLVGMLEHEPDPAVRIAAIDSVGQMQHESALVPLARILQSDPLEDARLAAARAFGKWRIPMVEEVLLTLLQKPKGEPDAVLWSSVRSLGNISRTPEALDVLNRLKRSVSNEIVLMTIDVAARKIAQRLEGLQRMERHINTPAALPAVDVIREADASGTSEDVPQEVLS